jgi:hypothetical protein
MSNSLVVAVSRWWVVLPLAALLLVGCRTQPYLNSHIESVNAEYRQLEDYVYALEEENGRLQQEIEALKSANETGRPSGGAAPRGGIFRRSPASNSPRRGSAPADSSPDLGSPQIEMPGSPSTTTQRPSLGPGESPSPADTPPSIDAPQLKIEVPAPKADELLPVPPAARDVLHPTPSEPISPRPVNKKVTHLFLNPTQTGCADFDGQPGDDGLRIVLEPRNSDNDFVPEAGPLSIVLLDPEREGEAARIARWDFDQSNSRQLLASSGDKRGIQLEVPWPAAAPSASKLKLFVRYETDDGRKLVADRDIYLNAQAQATSRWTPRTSRR